MNTQPGRDSREGGSDFTKVLKGDIILEFAFAIVLKWRPLLPRVRLCVEWAVEEEVDVGEQFSVCRAAARTPTAIDFKVGD